MIKRLKRPISFLSAFAMFTAMMSYFPGETFSDIKWGMTVFAEENGYDGNGFGSGENPYQPATLTTDKHDIDGDGTNDEVYEIGNAGQLYWFAGLVNGTLTDGTTQNAAACAKLTADIAVNTGVLKSDGTLADEISNFISWTPIGGFYNNSVLEYTGSFDGDGKKISGLYFNNSVGYVGLFGMTGSSARISNVDIVDSYFNAIVGVGGVCGYNFGTITDCSNQGSISGSNYIGGICGTNYGAISNCSNSGNITGTGSEGGIGGVCGNNVQNNIMQSYNTGSVSGTSYVGGVCGINGFENSGTLNNCYNTGAISGTVKDIGGICGCNGDKSMTKNCYNGGVVSGKTFVGSVCGYNRGIVKTCFALETEDHISEIGGNNSTNTVNEAQTINVNQFANGKVCYLLNGSDKVFLWRQNLEIDSLPVLDESHSKVYSSAPCHVNFSNSPDGVSTVEHSFKDGTCEACGIGSIPELVNDVYRLETAEHLYWFAGQVNSGQGNINAVLTNDITVNTGELSENTIGAKVWSPIGNNQVEYSGTFDGNGHTISGLYIDDTSENHIGLFGEVSNSGKISNVGVVNSYIKGSAYAGGVCGYNTGTITNCYNSGTVSGSNTGGVCGYNEGTITNCYNSGTVSGKAGGVCGYNTGTIINCYNTGNVIGSVYISGTGERVICAGGVCESNYGNSTNCYYDKTVFTGNAIHFEGENASIKDVDGKTTSEFKSGEVAYLLQGEQTEVVWGQKLGEDGEVYPVLDSTKKVYQINIYKGCVGNPGDPSNGYSNTNAPVYAEHNYILNTNDNAQHICTICNGYENHADVATFTANNETHRISATCLSCDDLGTVALSASDTTYDGNQKAATIEGTIKGFDTPSIVYEKKIDGNFATIDYTPIDAGTYRASITYNVREESKVVSVEYTIAKADTTRTANCVMELQYDKDSESYTATITKEEGAEYRFGESGTWSTENKLTGIAPDTEVTGYIRIAGDDNHNPGTESSKTLTSGHGILTHYEAKEADCLNDGNKEYWYCESCKKYFSDSEGTTEITEDALKNGTATNHSWNTETYEMNATHHWHNCQNTNCPVTDNSQKDGYGEHVDANSDEKCDTCGAYMDGIGARLAGHSLTLDGSVGVNFYMELSSEVTSDISAYMEFTLPGGKTATVKVNEAPTEVISGKTYYKFRCQVNAAEMTDTITAQLKSTAGNSKIYTYTVKDYADYLFAHQTENTEFAEAAALIEAMVNYGSYAQIYAGYNTDNLAVGDAGLKSVADVTIDEYTYTPNENETKVKFAGANLSLLSTTTLRMYFSITDVAADSVTFTYNGNTLEKTQSGDYYYVELAGIPASELNDNCVVTVNNGTTTFDVTYTPMAYCYNVVSRETTETRTEALKNLIKALALYNRAADAYISKINNGNQ